MVVAPNLSRTYKVKLKENIQATAVDVIKCLKQSKQPVPFHICKTNKITILSMHLCQSYKSMYDGPLDNNCYWLLERTLPYWNKVIVPQMKAGKRILIVAHGTSLR